MAKSGWMVKLKNKEAVTYKGENYSILRDSEWLEVVFTQAGKSRTEKRRFWFFFTYDYKVIEIEEVEQICLMAPKDQVEYVKLFHEDKENELKGTLDGKKDL